MAPARSRRQRRVHQRVASCMKQEKRVATAAGCAPRGLRRPSPPRIRTAGAGAARPARHAQAGITARHPPADSSRSQTLAFPRCHRHSWYFQALFASVIRRTRARSGFLTAGTSPCPDGTGPRSRISLPRARAEHSFRCGPSMHTPRQAIVAASSRIYCQGLLNSREAARPERLDCAKGAQYERWTGFRSLRDIGNPVRQLAEQTLNTQS
jgi:hypothetical protein